MVTIFQQTGAECILGHTEPRNFIIATLTGICLVFALIYALYIHILVKFVRRKKKLLKLGVQTTHNLIPVTDTTSCKGSVVNKDSNSFIGT